MGAEKEVGDLIFGREVAFLPVYEQFIASESFKNDFYFKY